MTTLPTSESALLLTVPDLNNVESRAIDASGKCPLHAS